uniref:PIH1 domain containing 2 n=1 Tax=Echeneis naucrates TaxID=173247 RepID=A0A665TQD8_ECHNA
MSSRCGTQEVLQQVNQIWSMLDDLSENDPEAYSSFIRKQMEGQAEVMSPPQLHSCLRTDTLEQNKGLLYINICSWKCVPAPKDPSKPLPIYPGELETCTSEDQDLFSVLDVALNPAVLEERKKEKTDIYMLTLSFAQQHLGLRLSQAYTVISSSPRSSPDDFHRRLGFQKWSKTPKQPNTASQTPAALLQQISSLRSKKHDVELEAQIIPRPAEHKKDLIQVISTTLAQPMKPEYQLQVKIDAAGVPHSVELTVELPKVCLMSESQFVSDDVLLEVEDIYFLLVEFPKPVKEDTASAVFNKKKRRLTLKVDVF